MLLEQQTNHSTPLHVVQTPTHIDISTCVQTPTHIDISTCVQTLTHIDIVYIQVNTSEIVLCFNKNVKVIRVF